MHKYWPRGYKKFFMLSLAEHEFSLLINMKMPTNIGIFIFIREFSCSAMFSKKEIAMFSNLIFISRTNFMLS